MIKRFLVASVIVLSARQMAAVEKSRVEAWVSTLAKTSQLLKDHSYREAIPMLEKLTNDMLKVLGPSDETTYVLVVPLIQRAIAEAGVEDRAAALWHWQMAQAMYPKAAGSDLSMFGEPGSFLKSNILADPVLPECPHRPESVPRPEVIEHVEPKYPEGARQFRSRGLVIIALRIGADGSVTEPRLVHSFASPLTYATMEAARKWRFSPAVVDGKPVAADFCLTINYKLQ